MNEDLLNEKIMHLRSEIEAGHIRISPGLDIVDSLMRIRVRTDGTVDLDTVDGSIRALLNAMDALSIAEEIRRIPLIEVQTTYFEILEQFFGRPFSEMKKHELDPYQVAANIASQEKMVQALVSDKDAFTEMIRGFWTEHAPTLYAHLRDMSCLKVVFGGDISPSYTHNIASSVGLYMDTIILPDPLLRATQFLETMEPRNAVFYLVKHALNILGYKELALADVEPPIVVIVPDLSALHDPIFEQLRHVSEEDALVHCSTMFQTELSSMDELLSFLEKAGNIEQLEALIANPARLLFDTDWKGPLRDQFRRATDEVYGLYKTSEDEKRIPNIILSTAFGRMMQINDLLYQSIQVGGSPLIDAPTSWQYLLWKYEYDEERSEGTRPNVESTLISLALQAKGDPRLKLISNIPARALIDLRVNDVLRELREIIGEGFNAVDFADPDKLSEISEIAVTNINNALTKHRDELDMLSKKRRRIYGVDVTSFVTVAGLVIAAPFIGNAALTSGAAVLGLVGVKPAIDVVKDGRLLHARSRELKRSPVGILYKHLEN